MSAFIVSDEHISYIIEGALEIGRRKGRFAWYWDGKRFELSRENAQEIGQILLNENHRSVNHRYRQEGDAPDLTLTWWVAPFNPVQLLKAIDCLEYQSCETPEYQATKPYSFLKALREWTISEIPGYREAAWEIGELSSV